MEIQAPKVILIIDKSGSMEERDMPPNGQSRWNAAEESVQAIANKIFNMNNELDVWLFSNTSKHYPNVDPQKVKQIFQENDPLGGTQMADVLQKAFEDYFKRKEVKKHNETGEVILVITDGKPDDEREVIDVLVKTANRLKPEDKLAVNFVQVGHDLGATRFLNYLDNELKGKEGAPRDIVETIKLETIEKIGFKQTILDTIFKTTKV